MINHNLTAASILLHLFRFLMKFFLILIFMTIIIPISLIELIHYVANGTMFLSYDPVRHAAAIFICLIIMGLKNGN